MNDLDKILTSEITLSSYDFSARDKNNLGMDWYDLVKNYNAIPYQYDTAIIVTTYNGHLKFLKQTLMQYRKANCFILGAYDSHYRADNIPEQERDIVLGYDIDGTTRDIGALFYDQRIPFIRGDTNRDNSLDISDPISTLFYLFSDLELKCLNAADSNDDHKIDVSDIVYSLNYLFLDGNPPKSPFHDAGIYDAPGNLGCREY